MNNEKNNQGNFAGFDFKNKTARFEKIPAIIIASAFAVPVVATGYVIIKNGDKITDAIIEAVNTARKAAA
ncbi:hypothetical protein PY093_20120 [Cytobacillus sp. S13-E01]|uniref:hypothetical protein n=1 Tax=Cytobacillus sp. S13-E01 TaxID=3031326 RepID=UPI0023D88A4F|nr:hypothetical protein [Cytobacillus sp. S13-E01]MDF0728922.1 hypothetical protein [Cytobacillus sp. S13-E01]